MKNLIPTLICLFLVIPSQAGIIYVDANVPPGGDGSSWETAYKYLQDALADANSNADINEIWVAQGIYTPDSNSADPNGSGDRTATFQLLNGVALYGGFPSDEDPNWNDRDPNSYETILSGDLDGNDIDVNDPCDLPNEPTRAENSYHVVTGSGTEPNAILDGFTITAGNANGVWEDRTSVGAGMFNDSGSPTLTNCTLSGNTATDWGGGGILCERGGATIANCYIAENTAAQGGGIFCFESEVNITDCIFNDNTADEFTGSEIGCKYSSLRISNCTISKYPINAVPLLSFHDDSSVIISNCSVSGGIVGIECVFWSSATITNCTVSTAGESAIVVGGNSNSSISNCILWSVWKDWEGAESYYEHYEISLWEESNVSVIYTDVQGGQGSIYIEEDCTLDWGVGNIDADPRFVEPGYWDTNNTPDDANDDSWVDGDYYLLPDSLCIDAGDPIYVAEPNETDLDGNPRVIGDAIDMGAYESNYIQAAMKLTPQTLNCNSRGKWVKAHLTLPEEFSPEDVDVNEAAVAEPMGIESEYIKVLGAGTGPVRLEICFDREVFCDSVTETGEVKITVIGSLTISRYFHATDTIKIKP